MLKSIKSIIVAIALTLTVIFAGAVKADDVQSSSSMPVRTTAASAAVQYKVTMIYVTESGKTLAPSKTYVNKPGAKMLAYAPKVAGYKTASDYKVITFDEHNSQYTTFYYTLDDQIDKGSAIENKNSIKDVESGSTMPNRETPAQSTTPSSSAETKASTAKTATSTTPAKSSVATTKTSVKTVASSTVKSSKASKASESKTTASEQSKEIAKSTTTAPAASVVTKSSEKSDDTIETVVADVDKADDNNKKSILSGLGIVNAKADSTYASKENTKDDQNWAGLVIVIFLIVAYIMYRQLNNKNIKSEL